MALLINLYSLRSDINAELAASERLAKILLEASSLDQQQPPDAANARLRTLIDAAPLRHLRISVDPPEGQPPPEATLTQLASLLGMTTPLHPVEQVKLGHQTLYITDRKSVV